MVKRRHQGGGALVVGADGKADRALRRCRHEQLWIEHGGGAVAFAQAIEARHRQHGGISDAAEQLLEPCADIAAEGHDFEVRALAQHLRLAPNGGGAELRPLRQMVEALHRDRDEGVAHILALEEGREPQSVRQARGDILAGMNAHIDAALQHRLVDFLGEQTLAADFGQAGIGGLRAVAAG